MLAMTFVSAAGASRIRRPVEKRFAAPVSAAAPSIKPAGWVAAAIGGPQPTDAKLTSAKRAAQRSSEQELWSFRAARWSDERGRSGVSSVGAQRRRRCTARSGHVRRGQAGFAASTASITINPAQPASVPIKVMGPGHVIGLDRRQIIRTDPAQARRVSSRITSHWWKWMSPRCHGSSRLREPAPRIACDRGCVSSSSMCRTAFDSIRQPSGSVAGAAHQWTGKARRRVARPERQLGVGARPGDIRTERDDRGTARRKPRADGVPPCARVFCSPTAQYLACVVPTFDLGCKAGLGRDITQTTKRSCVRRGSRLQRASSFRFTIRGRSRPAQVVISNRLRCCCVRVRCRRALACNR